MVGNLRVQQLAVRGNIVIGARGGGGAAAEECKRCRGYRERDLLRQAHSCSSCRFTVAKSRSLSNSATSPAS